MSEYQYYEFLALDRPLTGQQRDELRSISTRAEITATRFVNEYQWGDLYCGTDTVSFSETGSHLILSFYVDREPDDDWDEPGGQLAAMVQARSELAAGDLRLLYLAWLLALQSDEVDDEDTEPPVPAGLANLSAALQAIADFFEIDEDLIAEATASSPSVPSIQEPGGMTKWIASLPEQEKGALLVRVAAGEGAQVQALLLRRFRASNDSPPAAPGRTAAELWLAAADRKATRLKAEERRQRAADARRAAAQAAAYAKRLDKLEGRTEAAWERAAELIETRRPDDYDLATSLLRDLQALAERHEELAAFRKRFAELRAQHQRKPSLLDRFNRAGLPS